MRIQEEDYDLCPGLTHPGCCSTFRRAAWPSPGQGLRGPVNPHSSRLWRRWVGVAGTGGRSQGPRLPIRTAISLGALGWRRAVLCGGRRSDSGCSREETPQAHVLLTLNPGCAEKALLMSLRSRRGQGAWRSSRPRGCCTRGPVPVPPAPASLPLCRATAAPPPPHAFCPSAPWATAA